MRTVIELFVCELSHFGSSNYTGGKTMSALLDGLLGSLAASTTKDSEMSGSFQSGVGGGGDYDYGGTGIDRSGYGHDHHGGHSGYHHHSGYHEDKCCPLVVDALCLAAILGAIAGATVFLARTFQIELCRVNGANIRTPCVVGRRRRKREIEVPYNFNDWSSAGLYGRARIVIEGKICSLSIYVCI